MCPGWGPVCLSRGTAFGCAVRWKQHFKYKYVHFESGYADTSTINSDVCTLFRIVSVAMEMKELAYPSSLECLYYTSTVPTCTRFDLYYFIIFIFLIQSLSFRSNNSCCDIKLVFDVLHTHPLTPIPRPAIL